MTLSKDLAREHQEIDQGIASFTMAQAPTTATTASLTRALDELRRHIYFEEEFLFPPLRQAGLVPPLFVMCREHGEIWTTMTALSAATTSDTDPASLRDLLDRLTAQLSEHNMKEETIVYPAADQMIAGADLDELETELPGVRMPPGWVCEAAR